jgi:hypothetical protein
MPKQEKRPPVLGELASDRGDSIDYRDPHSVNYLDRSHMGTIREGKLIGDGRKATQWKSNYHTARTMMGVATMLRELEAAPGREQRIDQTRARRRAEVLLTSLGWSIA